MKHEISKVTCKVHTVKVKCSACGIINTIRDAARIRHFHEPKNRDLISNRPLAQRCTGCRKILIQKEDKTVRK